MSIIRADSIKNRVGDGAPDFPNGITVTGVVTATTLNSVSNIIDVDQDSPEAQKFIHMLPETLTIGKKINGRPVATHKLYSYDGTCKTESFGKNTDEGCQIELLTNTQTRVVGDRIILKDVKPKKLTFTEFNNLKNIIKKIYTLAVLT